MFRQAIGERVSLIELHHGRLEDMMGKRRQGNILSLSISRLCFTHYATLVSVLYTT